ncbi:mucin-3A isoform X2 [Hydra vulgaris]|uniref:Mucin-3A isoform X2 n=1 Tax=Hydra vulgaris TaxID=6087 RepID=A0ABM4BTG2_HYDVU
MDFSQSIFVWMFIEYVYGIDLDNTSVETSEFEAYTSYEVGFSSYSTFLTYTDVSNTTALETVQQSILQNTQANNEAKEFETYTSYELGFSSYSTFFTHSDVSNTTTLQAAQQSILQNTQVNNEAKEFETYTSHELGFSSYSTFLTHSDVSNTITLQAAQQSILQNTQVNNEAKEFETYTSLEINFSLYSTFLTHSDVSNTMTLQAAQQSILQNTQVNINKSSAFTKLNLFQVVTAVDQDTSGASSSTIMQTKNNVHSINLMQTLSLSLSSVASTAEILNKKILQMETNVDSLTLSIQFATFSLGSLNLSLFPQSTTPTPSTFFSSPPSTFFSSTPSTPFLSPPSTLLPISSKSLTTFSDWSIKNNYASTKSSSEIPILEVSDTKVGNVTLSVTSSKSSSFIEYSTLPVYSLNNNNHSQMNNDLSKTNLTSNLIQQVSPSEISIASVINQMVFTSSIFSASTDIYLYHSYNTILSTNAPTINVTKVFKVVYYCDFDETITALGGFLPAQNIFCKQWLFVNLSVSVNCSIFKGSIVVVIQTTGSESAHEEYKNLIISFITNGNLNVKINNDSVKPDQDSFLIDGIKLFVNNETFKHGGSDGRSYTAIVVPIIIAVACIVIIIVVFVSKRKKWKTNVSPIDRRKVSQQLPPSYNTAQEGIQKDHGIMNQVFEES